MCIDSSLAPVAPVSPAPPGRSKHHSQNNPLSRATKVNTVRPCPPRGMQTGPHMQVGPGQEFEVEWMTGHSNSLTFFAIVRGDDEIHLQKHSETMLKRYIKEAPPGAVHPGPEKVHIGMSGTPNGGGSYEYAKKLAPGDKEFIPRPGPFKRKYAGGVMSQYKYTDSMRKQVRVRVPRRSWHRPLPPAGGRWWWRGGRGEGRGEGWGKRTERGYRWEHGPHA